MTFQPSSRARRDATGVSPGVDGGGCSVSTLIPREAGCDVLSRRRIAHRATVSTLIPREAGCDKAALDPRPAIQHVSTLIPREAGCDPGTGAGAADQRPRFNPHPARGGMRRVIASSIRARFASCFNPHPARGGMRHGVSPVSGMSSRSFNPHPARGGMRQDWAGDVTYLTLVSTLIPREAGCDRARSHQHVQGR